MNDKLFLIKIKYIITWFKFIIICSTKSGIEHCIIGLFVCLCFTSPQQRGHLETAPPFTVPCEGREAP